MPLQNRVTPFGEIVAVAARGTFMGNRGRLHSATRQLTVSRWQLKAWIICVLEFKDRHRTVMSPNSYTELFFLDEATALSAGHRPCFECQRTAARGYVEAWLRGNPDAGLDAGTRIGAIDERLHEERVGRHRSQRTHRTGAASLPDGVFVTPDDAPGEAYLLWQGALHRWTPEGYMQSRALPAGDVRVLTPRSSVNALAAGYVPVVHASVESLGGQRK